MHAARGAAHALLPACAVEAFQTKALCIHPHRHMTDPMWIIGRSAFFYRRWWLWVINKSSDRDWAHRRFAGGKGVDMRSRRRCLRRGGVRQRCLPIVGHVWHMTIVPLASWWVYVTYMQNTGFNRCLSKKPMLQSQIGLGTAMSAQSSSLFDASPSNLLH